MARVISIEQLLRGSDSDIAQHERKLSRLLVAFIGAGLAFMLLPGTFLGVWNLFAISSQRAAQGISDAWIQAHGHAQVFGWIGCFLLGIGYHSIPKMTGSGSSFAFGSAVISLMAWITGVSLRWFANVYLWHWRTLLPLSAALEIIAFLMFFKAVSQHKSTDRRKSRLESWILAVIAGSLGWLTTLIFNFYGCLHAALHGDSPAFPSELDQRFLVLLAWGFLVPHVWGFSAKWLPVFLGLRPVRERALLLAVSLNVAGVTLAFFKHIFFAGVVLLVGSLTASFAIRVFAVPERPAKVAGVHTSFPIFVRTAYVWLTVASSLGIWASLSINARGIWGASRHALTVGFISLMVFCIGQRVLPAFSGMKVLWSRNLMFINCSLLTFGCALRVTSEVLAYEGFSARAWTFLPISAVIELAAVTAFATNLIVTFMQPPAHAIRLRQEATATARAVS